MELKNLFIEPTNKTPQVDLNYITGELILSGRSIPENAAKIYEQVVKWIKQYISDARQITNLRLNLEYFNTASSLWLGKIVQILTSINNPDYTLFIHLYINVEEFDTMDGNDLEETLSPFISMIGTPALNMCIKVYGTDDSGEIIKESLVLI